MKRFIKSKIRNLKLRWARTNPKRYVRFLRKQGVKIGNDLFITRDLKSLSIDITRPSLIEIGDRVRLNKNLTLTTHDGAFYVLKNKYNEFIASSGKIIIGNNVYFGRNCTVLKGVKIGDNCIIGNGSIVTKDIPSNSIAVGIPAKVLTSLDDYYEKRKHDQIQEAFEYARSIKERFNRKPIIEDFWEEFPLFVNGNEVDKFPTLPIKRQLGKSFEIWKKDHRAVFDGFEDFIKQAGIE